VEKRKYLAPSGVQTLNSSARTESLYQLPYRGPKANTVNLR